MSDLRRFNRINRPTYVCKLRNAPQGRPFYHIAEGKHAFKACDAYQTLSTGQEVIFGVNDLVEVWK